MSIVDIYDFRPYMSRGRRSTGRIPDAIGTRTEPATAPLPTLSTLKPTRHARAEGTTGLHDQLGWEPGGRLDMDTLHGMILIADTPTGQHTVDHRNAISLPRCLRR
jgi:hypothetical protein